LQHFATTGPGASSLALFIIAKRQSIVTNDPEFGLASKPVDEDPSEQGSRQARISRETAGSLSGLR
jgi:hypothetical protein